MHTIAQYFCFGGQPSLLLAGHARVKVTLDRLVSFAGCAETRLNLGCTPTKTGTKLNTFPVLFASASIPGAGMHCHLRAQLSLHSLPRCGGRRQRAGGFVCSEQGSRRAAGDRANWIDEHIGDHPGSTSYPEQVRGHGLQRRRMSSLHAAVDGPAGDIWISPARSSPIMSRSRTPTRTARSRSVGPEATATPQAEARAEAPQDDDGRQRASGTPQRMAIATSTTSGSQVAAQWLHRRARKHADACRYHHRL